MKSAIIRGLMLVLVLLGFLAGTPLAFAQRTNHSGTICKNSNAEDATLIEYPVTGLRSLKPSATSIICPLVRNTSNSNGALVYVDVSHTGTQTTTCTAYSYNANGSIRLVKTQPWTGSGAQTIKIDLTGSGKSDSSSNYSVYCSIPGNRNSIVYGVDLDEQ